jgi:hypothetical protein
MLDAKIISELNQKLNSHLIYSSIQTKKDLQIFMQHHIFSVWDFMSLIKYLQNIIAPTTYPWVPNQNTDIKRFINELVLEEESDEDNNGNFSSHFELYLTAMAEVGADTSCINKFIQTIQEQNLDAAFNLDCVPNAAREFSQQTFKIIASNKPHLVASYLALGREHIIPTMFRLILAKIGINDKQAPIFHFYLNRHIHLDEDFHAPLSLKLVNSLCTNDTTKNEAIVAGKAAVNARLKFWDGVYSAIHNRA